MLKIYYEDDNGNKVFIPENTEDQPKGEIKFKFNGKNSFIYFGKKVQLPNATFHLDNNCQIIIDNNSVLRGNFLTLLNSSRIYIGKNTKFQSMCRVQAAEGTTVKIGENCLFADVWFRTCDFHSIIDLDTNKRINPSADIVIEDNVWIAEDVRVYKGVTIGHSSVIGARSTVTKSLPSNTLSVGTPAKVVKANITWNKHLL